MDHDMDLNSISSSWGKRQVSAYFPSRETQVAAPRRAAVLKLALFAFFIVTRALHPMLIDLSKRDGTIMYAKNTPVVMNKILTIALMNVVAFLGGGLRGVRECWQPRCMMVFGLIGTIYALGDFLEMLSMSKLSGGMYQVLLQTKLLITALMAWWLKGSRQSSLQWQVLLLMFLATSCFVLVDQDSSPGESDSLPLVAILCVLLKVAVSCYCAVLSEKYLKAFSDMSLPAKISGMATTWALASLLLSGTEPQVVQHGFFANWDSATWLVTASFVVKTVSTMYLLQALDSVQKNIGEAVAVIVIYASQVLLPSVDKAFDLSVFLLAVLVVGSVKAYLSAPKAPKRKGAKASDMRLVSLNTEGPSQLQGLGVDSLLCEVSGVLPPGVFYGMLGGVYPVCGRTNPESPNNCDLMMLAHPPWSPQVSGDAFGSTTDITSTMPSQSLTILGQLREEGSMDLAQCRQDLEKSREKIAGHFVAGV